MEVILVSPEACLVHSEALWDCDGGNGINGQLVMVGHQFSKSTFGANKVRGDGTIYGVNVYNIFFMIMSLKVSFFSMNIFSLLLACAQCQ